MMEFYKRLRPKARKTHFCEYCGCEIHTGEQYSYESGKYEGEFFTRTLCLVCLKMLSDFCGELGEEEFDWDWVDDWLSDGYCRGCEHGAANKDDCEYYQPQCPFIRERFAQERGNE